MRHIRWGTCALAALLALTTFSTSPALARHGHTLPHTIDLPNGWQPEGITTDGKFVYSGSLANGAIFRANVRTGNGKVIAAGTTGRVAAGLDYDRRRDLLWVVGGPTGQIRAQDADTGKVLAAMTSRQHRPTDGSSTTWWSPDGRSSPPTPSTRSSR